MIEKFQSHILMTSDFKINENLYEDLSRYS